MRYSTGTAHVRPITITRSHGATGFWTNHRAHSPRLIAPLRPRKPQALLSRGPGGFAHFRISDFRLPASGFRTVGRSGFPGMGLGLRPLLAAPDPGLGALLPV